MTGRPSSFTQEMADTICLRMMEGESLRSICRDEAMPARSTVHKWLSENKAFSDQYAQAHDMRADEVFDEMFEIADNASNDWMTANDPDNDGFKLNGEHVQRARLRIDTRKWALSKMIPKKYGDKTAIVGGDPETDSPIQVDDRSLARSAAFLLTKEAHEGDNQPE